MFIFKNCYSDVEMSRTMICEFVKNVDRLLREKKILRIAIATGKTLEIFISLLKEENIPFERIDLYIVDEYAGMSCTDERSCTIDLINLFGEKVNKFHSIKVFSTNDYMCEIEIFHNELTEGGLHICVLGVGSDGHVGFCYPPIKPHSQKFYELLRLSDERKKEHVLNGWFPSVDTVPDYVISFTLWGIMQSSIIMIGAVLEKKKHVVEQMYKPTVPALTCPVLYLAEHNKVTVYLG